MAINPTTLKWKHDGKNTDGTAFDSTQFQAWDLEVNSVVALQVPVAWSTGGAYEIPLATLAIAQANGTYSLRMRLVAKNGNKSDWSVATSFTIDRRTPSVPKDLAVT